MSEPMTIGQLEAAMAIRDSDKLVKFDFVHFHPHDCHSYRGYYERPAIGYSNEGDPPTVKDFCGLLHQLTHLEFTGYKGGDYTYDASQVLYVANRSEAAGTVIVGIDEDRSYVMLKTGHIDD